MPETYILGYIKNGEFHRFYEGMVERLSDLQIMKMNLQTAGARWEIRKSGEVYNEKVLL